MVLFDHRMVEGSPLWYHYQPNPAFFYQHREEVTFLDYNINMSEELLAPRSPQSDSENSMSSIEVSIASQNKEIQCRWMNCGTYFETLDQLASHVGKTHASSGAGGLFYCGWEGCTRNDRGFNARYKMLVHVRTHTNEKPHQCCQCSKSFSRAENLKIHARSHSGEKPYVCNVAGCNKAYSNSSDRFKHSRTHQEDKPYQCKIPGCPKRYTDPSSLRKHVKTYKHYASDATYDDEEKVKKTQVKRKCPNDGCCTPDDCLGGRAAEIFKFGAFINSRVRCWDQLLDPFIKPSFEMEIDLDTPLDLSISRKQ